MQCITCHGISLCRHAGSSVLGSFASTDGHVASLMLLYQQIKLYRPRSACSSFAGVGTVPDWLHVQGHCDVGALMQCYSYRVTLLHKARAYAYEKYIYAISHIYIYISGLRGNTNISAHTNITQTTNTPLSLTTRKRNKCTCRHEISAVLFPLGSQGGFQFEKHRTHITTCECVPQSLCDFSHSSNIWILTYSPPRVCKGLGKVQRHLGGANTMKQKGTPAHPPHLRRRGDGKTFTCLSTHIVDKIFQNITQLKQHKIHDVEPTHQRFHVCLFQFFFWLKLVWHMRNRFTHFFCFGGRSHSSLSP